MVEDLRILEQEFCPPLDPAVVHAIYLDYAGAPDAMQLARVPLESLKIAADEELLTDFDPSGSGGAVGFSPGKESDEADSNVDSWATRSSVTDHTNTSNDLSALSLGERSESNESLEGGYFKDAEHLDVATKERLLIETFPSLRPEFVAQRLKKCDNDFSKAIDELLNHVYFEDTKASPTGEAVVIKGVDAFEEKYQVHRKRKGKKKQRALLLHDASAPSSYSDISSSPRNKWEDGSRDVDFITLRTKISPATIQSLYHKNGGSRPATIKALLDKEVAALENGKEPDAAILQAAIDLTSDFPSIDLEYAIALIQISAPSTANAHELAKALTVYPATTGKSGGLTVIPRYAPVNLSGPASAATKLPSLPPSALPQTTASLAAARSHAFTQASAAYRKGKSSPLMKAAAGYYSQVGRDLSANLRAMSDADADMLVSSQSSAGHLDLHGVSVQNATRIAKERVQRWWDDLGEERILGGGRRGAGDGFRVITGLGRHSEGGKGKIGPAVVRTLVKEGWKVEVGSGELLVTGMTRRR